ncbi:MAG TPA: hypothetical protein VGR28_04010 [Candidatus Thermoplasmatota archaeon]|jgi:hypothetical protein|nr:hypothetical protein [Candidatus Thermoplasmatota archaeon]
MRATVILVLASLLAAGCLGGPSNPPAQQPSAPAAPPPARNNTTTPTPPPSNATGNGTGNATPGNATANMTAPAPLPFTFDATCREALALVPVEVAAVRGFVPPNFTLVGEQGGRVPVFFGLKECPSYSVDGGPPRAVMISDVGALIDSPDGSEGSHYYQLWLVTNDSALWAQHAALGFVGGVAATTFSASQPAPVPAPLALGVSADIPWANGTYGFDATIPSAAPTAPAATFVGWHLGPEGLIRMPKDFTYTAYGAGSSDFRAAAGSPAASLTGESAQGSALYNEYAMTGRAQLAEGNATMAR